VFFLGKVAEFSPASGASRIASSAYQTWDFSLTGASFQVFGTDLALRGRKSLFFCQVPTSDRKKEVAKLFFKRPKTKNKGNKFRVSEKNLFQQ